MTFLQLQAMVLGTRFSESQRGDAMAWLNARLGELLSLEDWSFLAAEDAVTLNSATVSAPANAGIATGIIMADDGDRLEFLGLTDFQQRYLGLSTTGRPEAFTVLGSNLLIGPTPDTAYSARLEHRSDTFTAAGAAALVNDSDVPITPAWSHPSLAAGAAASMLLLENDPTWQPLEAQFKGSIDALRRRCLATGRGQRRQMPRDPLAYL